MKETAALVWGLLEEDMSARRLCDSTRRHARVVVKNFLRWASQRSTPDVCALTGKDLVAWYGWLGRVISPKTGRPPNPRVVGHDWGIIRQLYSVLYRSGVIAENPAHGLRIKVPKADGWKRRPMTREEITTFLESLDTGSAIGLRDRCLFELIYSSGLRINEAACLKVADIDFERRIMIVRGKFDRDRMVPISEVASDFLQLFLGERAREAQAWVFASWRGSVSGHIAKGHINRCFQRHLKRLGMTSESVSAHSIRHSTATHLLENGASIRHVQELLGHANIENTARYTHVMTDTLAKVFRKHHPREHELFEVVDQDYLRRLASLERGN